MWKRFSKQPSQLNAFDTTDASSENSAIPSYGSGSADIPLATDSPDKTSPYRSRGITEDRGALGTMLSVIRPSSKTLFNDSSSLADAESERKVSQSAGRLGKDIQQIIMAAKAGGQSSSRPHEDRKSSAVDFENDAWKTQLLHTLGGTDIDVEQSGNIYASSDIDILLQNSTCDKFILRCMENELPPNLIHCLRLLRVLELQAAHSYARLQRNAKSSMKNTNSVSRSATDKVMRLLTMLCKDISVGEQLKPHLFGLLALPGASYPPNGMHIARAATEIVVAFSRYCLSPSLAMFLHDRKVIMNMTDDVKELCGLIEATNLTSGSLCLYGESAELAGLWVVGLRAIVHLVHASCSQRCVEILRDFYDAGGLDLLTFAIWNSRSNNAKKLLELVATLTYCKLETGLSRGEHDNSSSNFFNDFNKPPIIEKSSGDYGLASNPGVFQLIEDLMVRSVPFLKKYNEFYKSKVSLQKGTSIKELAKISLDISAELHVLSKMKGQNEMEVHGCDELASELLVSTLQLYTDHPRNYTIIEEKYHVLALYLLSFTSFSDVSIKVLILKTLEYICTGLSDVSPVIPLQITCEMLLAMSNYHLRLSVDEESIKSHEGLLSRFTDDSSMLLEVIEKLALMGPSVRDVLIAIGIFDEHFDDFSSSIMNSLSQDQQPIQVFNAPPLRTAFDEPFMTICRLLNISLQLSSHNLNNESESRKFLEGSLTLTGQSRDLNLLINAGVCEMGVGAAEAALAALGTKMSYYTSISQLEIDMLFLMQLSIHFSELILRLPSVIDTQENTNMCQFIYRQISILKTLSSVLTNNHDAIHSFRIGMGFDIIVRAVGSLAGVAHRAKEEDCDAALKLIKQCFDLLSIALTLKDCLSEGMSPEDYMGPSYDRDSYFDKVADSIAATGMLSFRPSGEVIIKSALHVIEPSLLLVKTADVVDEEPVRLEAVFTGSLRNPDAVSLALSIALRMPADVDLSCDAISTIYSLCLIESSRSFGQIASSGLCRKLIEYMTQVNSRHQLYCPMKRLFKKILSMRMNYIEFLSLFRRMIWPLFSRGGNRLSWSRSKSKLDMLNVSDSDIDKLDQKVMIALECLSEISEEGTRSAAIKLGGGSISTIAYEIQKGRLEERLQQFAKEGGVSFVQLNTAETSSHSILSTQALGANMAVAENLWAATSNSGFSYSIWIRVPSQYLSEGNMFLFDIATSPDDDSNRLSRSHYEYLSLFYDVKKQAFQIITSSSPKPISFSCISLAAGWHHVVFTYQPAKRSVLSRKVQIGLVIDGKAVETDTKIDPVMLPSKSRIYVGVPNPVLIISGIVSGPLLNWDMGSFILFSVVLGVRDATLIYLFGPNFEGNFWGDRPQRLSLSSIATVAFANFAIMNTKGSILEALEQCGISDFESSSHVSMENRFLGAYYEDSLSSMGLLFQVNPDAAMAAFRLSSFCTIEPYERRLYNLAKINLSELAATDATGFGVISVTIPQSFADNVRWAGGPSIFFPYVVSSTSIEQLILSLRMIRSSIYRHVPNIDYMQTCSGYRVLAHLLKEKKNIIDHRVIDECFGFAANIALSEFNDLFIEKHSDQLVLVDLEATKTILLNQHVWDLQSGPSVPLHLNSRLSLLIAPGAVNSPFNARRMHQVGIVPFMLDLMLEAAKMYNLGYLGAEEMKKTDTKTQHFLNAIGAFKNGWYATPPSSTIVSAGGDPGNPLLFSCKNLLRRVLAYMLTPMDLENMAASTVYTLSMDNAPIVGDAPSDDVGMDSKLLPGSVTRIYLLRILEELIIERIDVKVGLENVDINRSEQTRAFLSAFSGILRPIWFMSLLDRCRDEASTSAVFRLLVLMVQTCPSFIEAFIQEEGFKTLSLTIPKMSTSPSIILNLLGLLFHAPIWHLPCFATLQSSQLRDVFESEWDDIDLVKNEASVAGSAFPIAQGAFTLLLDCIVRNIRLSELNDKLGQTAVNINDAVLSVIEVCMKRSVRFREFSRTLGSFEPLTNAICASIGAKKRREVTAGRKRAETEQSSSLNIVLTEGKVDLSHGLLGSELRLVSIMRMIVSEVLIFKSSAASMIHALFRSYPPHASVDEVEGFHSVLIESCVLAVQECLLNANLITLSNMIGLCSVLLDRLRSGFFRRDDVLECVSVSALVLNSMLSFGAKTSGATLNESNILVTDALHIMRLICLTALQRFRYSTIIDVDMIPLQQKLSKIINSSLKNMLTAFPALVMNTSKKLPPESSAYQLWQSASIIRSRTSNLRSSYPDVHAIEDPERTFILVLLAEENFLLLQNNKGIREIALPVILMLLRERRTLMAELLKRDFRKGENRSETIDLINRGGFGALLALIDSPTSSSDSSAPQLLNDAFFDWIDRNQNQVTPIFDSIRSEAYARLPVFESNVIQAADVAIEIEQRMASELQSQTEEDIMLRGVERTRYLQQIYEQCLEYLSVWKRSGFSDIICGEFLWEKYVLQRKVDFSFESSDSMQLGEYKGDDETVSEPLQFDRLTLDLSEGFERQRRRLLPNHRFKSLYNIMDKEFLPDTSLVETKEMSNSISLDGKDGPYRTVSDSVDNVLQATAAILKVTKGRMSPEGDFESDNDFEISDGGDQAVIQSLALNQGSTVENTAELTELLTHDNVVVEKPEAVKVETDMISEEDGNHLDGKEIIASSLDLVMGFLIDGDKPEKVFNVQRCIGLEVRKAILLWCSRAIYIIDGFETIQGEGLLGRINRVEQYRTTFSISLRESILEEGNSEMANDTIANVDPDRAHDNSDGKKKTQKVERAIYRHRSQRISFDDVHCIYRRRYQLRQSALEFYDIHKTATLVAFDNQAKREEVLTSTLNARLPNSIFNSGIFGSTISLSYNKFMNNYRAKITNDWVSGKISNFDFLMHLNTFAGRSYNDLTQYPVFPWVLADYESLNLDLNDPSIYRDLSKPMGAIGESRAKQFKDRYDALEMHYLDQDEHEQPPPFHFGTHYSCAAYVVNYLIRLEPFTRLALTLQGGKFDLADRLFQSVAASWRSASRDNLQDVRELIPEFFYLPDFLLNKNAFNYGVTQHGKIVHHVTLPPWAKGDPTRFVRMQRKALESDFVSRNLHKWVDLVFGYKQRGREAVTALNTFVHVTYEGAVDLDTIEDPVVRESTLAQIHNFGQTPSRLEKAPFPSRNVASILKERNIDLNALAYLSHLTPSYCITGAPHKVFMKTASWDSYKLGMSGQEDAGVGDVFMSKGPIIGVGMNCIFVNASTYIRYDGRSNGISFHVAATSTRYREVDKVLSVIDDMHSSPITIARISSDGNFLITTCLDSTVRVWRVKTNPRSFERSYTLRLQGTLSGHEGVKVTCMDICSVFGTVVTCDAKGVILLWNLRTSSFLRRLSTTDNTRSPSAISVSLNRKNGNIVTLVGSSLKVFDINGIPVATLPPEFKFPMNNMPTCAISTSCQEWMDGIVAITGHMNGDVRMWSIDYDRGLLVFRHVIPDKVHDSSITCLRCLENQKNLLIGDSSGRISMASTMQLDSLSLSELAVVAEEIRMLSEVGSTR